MAVAETRTAQDPPRGEPARRAGFRWLAALKALGRLEADQEDTTQVFEIMKALNGRSTARNYARLLRTAEGGRIAYQHAELAPRLMDDAWLTGCAPGTVGAAYRAFVRNEKVSAEGLAEVSRQGVQRIDAEHPYAWFGRRIRDAHDIWHALSGYERDSLGEACLVAFSYAQTGGLGWAAIGLGAGLKALASGRLKAAAAIWQGYRRGRAAGWLLGEDYLSLMSEPLEAARQRLNIGPPTAYDAIPATARRAWLGRVWIGNRFEFKQTFAAVAPPKAASDNARIAKALGAASGETGPSGEH